jgi:hypothetical protein
MVLGGGRFLMGEVALYGAGPGGHLNVGGWGHTPGRLGWDLISERTRICHGS